MDVYSFDPLHDARWAGFVARHPNASVFHTAAWLRALDATYGFAPIAYTTSDPDGPLENALVGCAVRSWLTGSRLVSLPFSDHCDPLVDHADTARTLASAVTRERATRGWKYVELRPTGGATPPADVFVAAQTFELHRLDLAPDLAALRRGFHKDSIQRKIRRAEREGLVYEEGRSEALVRTLCQLLALTRRRHDVPLQPRAWFRNLVASFGEALCVRIASKDGRPAAGILTLVHRDRVVYKYGGSDTALNALGGVPFLFWKTIEDAKSRGARELDLGRSDRDNAGLITFKDHWGARRSTLTYWRAPADLSSGAGLGQRLFARLPGPLRRAAGGFLYRHAG